MLPLFGTRIYEMLFDPFDEYTKNAIIEDAVTVIQSEPRVELVDIDVYQEDQALTVAMILLFKPESVTDNLFVSFTLKDKETT
jgi:phage baseplate assembly protein W